MATIVIGQDDIVAQWVCERLGKLWTPGMGKALGWIDKNENLIAGVTFYGFDGVNVWIDCAATEKSRWCDRRAIWAVFHYCFEQLKVLRVNAFIPSDNEKSLKFNTGIGLKHEATLERAAPGGVDMFVYRMFRDECRWLSRKAV